MQSFEDGRANSYILQLLADFFISTNFELARSLLRFMQLPFHFAMGDDY